MESEPKSDPSDCYTQNTPPGDLLLFLAIEQQRDHERNIVPQAISQISREGQEFMTKCSAQQKREPQNTDYTSQITNISEQMLVPITLDATPRIIIKNIEERYGKTALPQINQLNAKSLTPMLLHVLWQYHWPEFKKMRFKLSPQELLQFFLDIQTLVTESQQPPIYLRVDTQPQQPPIYLRYLVNIAGYFSNSHTEALIKFQQQYPAYPLKNLVNFIEKKKLHFYITEELTDGNEVDDIKRIEYCLQHWNQQVSKEIITHWKEQFAINQLKRPDFRVLHNQLVKIDKINSLDIAFAMACTDLDKNAQLFSEIISHIGNELPQIFIERWPNYRNFVCLSQNKALLEVFMRLECLETKQMFLMGELSNSRPSAIIQALGQEPKTKYSNSKDNVADYEDFCIAVMRHSVRICGDDLEGIILNQRLGSHYLFYNPVAQGNSELVRRLLDCIPENILKPDGNISWFIDILEASGASAYDDLLLLKQWASIANDNGILEYCLVDIATRYALREIELLDSQSETNAATAQVTELRDIQSQFLLRTLAACRKSKSLEIELAVAKDQHTDLRGQTLALKSHLSGISVLLCKPKRKRKKGRKVKKQSSVKPDGFSWVVDAIQELKTSVAAHKEKKQLLAAKLKHTTETIQSLKRKIATQNATHQSNSLKLSASQKKTEDLNAQLEQQTQATGQQLADKDKAIKELQQSLQDAQGQLTSSTQKVESQADEIALLKRALQQSQAEAKRKDAAIAELEQTQLAVHQPVSSNQHGPLDWPIMLQTTQAYAPIISAISSLCGNENYTLYAKYTHPVNDVDFWLRIGTGVLTRVVEMNHRITQALLALGIKYCESKDPQRGYFTIKSPQTTRYKTVTAWLHSFPHPIDLTLTDKVPDSTKQTDGSAPIMWVGDEFQIDMFGPNIREYRQISHKIPDDLLQVSLCKPMINSADLKSLLKVIVHIALTQVCRQNGLPLYLINQTNLPSVLPDPNQLLLLMPVIVRTLVRVGLKYIGDASRIGETINYFLIAIFSDRSNIGNIPMRIVYRQFLRLTERGACVLMPTAHRCAQEIAKTLKSTCQMNSTKEDGAHHKLLATPRATQNEKALVTTSPKSGR